MTTVNRINKLESLIKTNECKIDTIRDKVDSYKQELKKLTDGKLDESMRFKNKVFYYKQDLEKYKQTKEYKLQQEPYFRCAICNVPIFDGVWELKDLLKNTNQLLNSNWRKHKQNCNVDCGYCGVIFHTRYQKNTHKCGVKDVKLDEWGTDEITCQGMNKKEYKQFRDHRNRKCTAKERIPTPEPVSSPEPISKPQPIKCEISEVESSSDEEYESWHYNYKNYYVGNKTKKVIDDHDEHIGYMYQNRLIHSDDDIYSDFLSDLEDN